MRVRVLRSPQALAEAAATEIGSWLDLDGNGHTIGLAGGGTPRPAYELLASQPLPWEQVTAWMTDERHVPSDHPDSNAGMVRSALLDHVTATLHEVPWNDNPHTAAEQYEAILRAVLPAGRDGVEPGLVILGVGTDGHTASLFPATSALTAPEDRDFVAVDVPGKGWRLTATFSLLARARRIVFLATGDEKADIVAEVLSGDSDLPAAVVSQAGRDVVWLLDRPAAAGLDDQS